MFFFHFLHSFFVFGKWFTSAIGKSGLKYTSDSHPNKKLFVILFILYFLKKVLTTGIPLNSELFSKIRYILLFDKS